MKVCYIHIKKIKCVVRISIKRIIGQLFDITELSKWWHNRIVKMMCLWLVTCAIYGYQLCIKQHGYLAKSMMEIHKLVIKIVETLSMKLPAKCRLRWGSYQLTCQILQHKLGQNIKHNLNICFYVVSCCHYSWIKMF